MPIKVKVCLMLFSISIALLLQDDNIYQTKEVVNALPVQSAQSKSIESQMPGTDDAELPTSKFSEIVTTLLARPLLSPTRRPLNASLNSVDGRTTELPSLVGVVIGDTIEQAVFKNTTGVTSIVGIGQYVQGYLVNSIALNTVTLVGAGGKHIVSIVKEKSVKVEEAGNMHSAMLSSPPSGPGSVQISPQAGSDGSDRRWIKVIKP